MSSPSTLDDGAPVKNEVLHADFKFEDVKPGMLFWLYTADKISSRLRLKWGLHAKAMGHPFLILDKRVVAGTDTVCGCICTSTYTPGRGLVELNGPKAIDDVGYYSENTEVKIRKEPRTTILEFSDDHSTCRRSYVDTWKVYFLDFALLKEPYRGYGTREAPITLTPGSFSKLRLSITAAAETAATLYRSPVPSLPDSFRGRMAARRHLAPGRIVWFGQRLKVAPATTISSHKYRGLYLIQRGLPEQEDRINSSLIIAYPIIKLGTATRYDLRGMTCVTAPFFISIQFDDNNAATQGYTFPNGPANLVNDKPLATPGIRFCVDISYRCGLHMQLVAPANQGGSYETFTLDDEAMRMISLAEGKHYGESKFTIHSNAEFHQRTFPPGSARAPILSRGHEKRLDVLTLPQSLEDLQSKVANLEAAMGKVTEAA